MFDNIYLYELEFNVLLNCRLVSWNLVLSLWE